MRLKFVLLDTNIIIRSVFMVKVGRLMQSSGDNSCFLTPDVRVRMAISELIMTTKHYSKY
jgi:hypothetical protein